MIVTSLASVNRLPAISQPLRWYVTLSLFTAGAGVYFFVLYFIEDETKLFVDSIFAWMKGIL